jgi:hypothetical protein
MAKSRLLLDAGNPEAIQSQKSAWKKFTVAPCWATAVPGEFKNVSPRIEF